MQWSMANTAAELKEACKNANLGVSGTKAKLLGRLQEHDDIQQRKRPRIEESQAALHAAALQRQQLQQQQDGQRARQVAAQAQAQAAATAAAAEAARQAASATAQVSLLEKLYKRYEDPDEPGVIGGDGIMKIGEDLGIDPSNDISILVLCYKLGAQTAGQISKQEFMQGMEKLRVDTVQKLKALLPSLDPGFMDSTTFRELYKFVFTFSREGTRKGVEKDIVCALLPLAMGNRSCHTGPFVKFMESNAALSVVTFDQWNSFLEFTKSVGEDLSNYDESGAWPCLIDDYVESQQQDQKA